MDTELESALNELIESADRRNEDDISAALTNLSFTKAAKTGKPGFPNEIINTLLDQLSKYKHEENRQGAWDLFHYIISNLEKLDDNQFDMVWNYLEESYGSFLEQNVSSLIAEWVGGFRDERSLKFIENWLKPETHIIPLTNIVNFALHEFLYAELPYEASSSLKEYAKELEKRAKSFILEKEK